MAKREVVFDDKGYRCAVVPSDGDFYIYDGSHTYDGEHYSLCFTVEGLRKLRSAIDEVLGDGET